MRTGSLFSGYGGLDAAVNAFYGSSTAWFVEFDERPASVLAARHPDVPNFGDITKVDWSQVEPVDILTGGFPCQDISNAGKREGITGKRSGLWHAMAEAVGELRPRIVVVENVAVLARRGLFRVVGDLAALGYDARWTVVRASEAGAAHRRERLFLIAYPANLGHEWAGEAWERWSGPSDGSGPAADAYGERLEIGAVQSDRDERQAAERDSGNVDWGKYAAAVDRWERSLGRPAPLPWQISERTGKRQLSARFVEWMMGLPNGYVVDVPRMKRNAALHVLGNGVVPQQAYEALRRLCG